MRKRGEVRIKAQAKFIPGDGEALARRLGLVRGGHPVAGVLLAKNGPPPRGLLAGGMRRSWRAFWRAGASRPQYEHADQGERRAPRRTAVSGYVPPVQWV